VTGTAVVDLFAALALAIVIEGLAVAFFSSRLPGILEALRLLGPEQLRWVGLAMAVVGTLLYLALRG